MPIWGSYFHTPGTKDEYNPTEYMRHLVHTITPIRRKGLNCLISFQACLKDGRDLIDKVYEWIIGAQLDISSREREVRPQNFSGWDSSFGSGAGLQIASELEWNVVTSCLSGQRTGCNLRVLFYVSDSCGDRLPEELWISSYRFR